MKLTILGSGTMLPTKNRFPSSFLLETEKTNVLLDCGHGTLARLTEIGVDPREIDLIFISHFHTDHFGDAFNLVHSRFVGDLYQQKKHSKLIFLGPKGIVERFQNWRKIFWAEPKENYPLEFLEGERECCFEDISLEIFSVFHVPWFDSVGIRLQAQDKIIAYPGDVGSKQDFKRLVKYAKNADLFLIEPGFEHPTPNHFTIEQTKELVQKAGVRKTLFVHLRPLESEEERVKKIIESNQNFLLAEDKMTLII